MWQHRHAIPAAFDTENFPSLKSFCHAFLLDKRMKGKLIRWLYIQVVRCRPRSKSPYSTFASKSFHRIVYPNQYLQLEGSIIGRPVYGCRR